MLDLNKNVFLNSNVQYFFEVLFMIVVIQNSFCVFSVP